MTDLSLTLTPVKRAECEVMTHSDEPPKRLHRSPTKDDGSGSDSDLDGPYGIFGGGGGVGVEEENDDEGALPDEVRNSEDYKKYLQIITESEGYDCGSFDFPYFDYIITQASKQLQEKRCVHVLPAIEKYNKEHNRKLVLDSIEKANLLFAICCFEKYFVTFKVKDMDDGGALKTFQCSFFIFVSGPSFEQFREKPTQP
ncbi:hypothetical protein AAHA92_14962 [Salvia divinorum]|uniref:Uncharacterized protein n=1 Tax=Salvia divinorum TaxID=28513 RepID=A0ABD1HDY7_SALDI